MRRREERKTKVRRWELNNDEVWRRICAVVVWWRSGGGLRWPSMARRVSGFGDFWFVEFFDLQFEVFEIKTKTKENRKSSLSPKSLICFSWNFILVK